jgi:hypothetical protein|tara:strand:- start:1512 stop:1622 length:111 start_codon:yes stop_codon:yes gene_type:complete
MRKLKNIRNESKRVGKGFVKGVLAQLGVKVNYYLFF